MTTYLIIAIVGIVVAIYVLILWKAEGEDYAEGKPIFIGIITFSVIVVIIFGTLFIYNFIKFKPYEEVEEKIEILSLKRENNTNGNFTLGSGSINSVSYYYYYYKENDNAIILGKVETEKSKIYETEFLDNETPRIEKWVKHNRFSQKTTYKIYVPIGTVIQIYELR